MNRKEPFTTRLNVMTISSMSTFANIKGGLNKGCRDVYFYRFVGVNDTYVESIREMDRVMCGRSREGKVCYKRMRELPRVGMEREMAVYIRIYKDWVDSGRTKISLPSMNNERFFEVLNDSCMKVLEVYRRINAHTSESQEQNFIVKLLFWLDTVREGLFEEWDERMCVKLVSENVCKRQEYLFYYLLTLLGFDVLLLQWKGDIDEEMDRLLLSGKQVFGTFCEVSLPDVFCAREKAPQVQEEGNVSSKKEPEAPCAATHGMPHINIPKRVRPAKGQAEPKEPETPAASAGGGRRTKTYEELALLSSSVVLIAIHNQSGQVIGTGSGIMISADGFILTNNHVASGGVYYSVKIEEDDQSYYTDEIVKYNSDLDLAIIRIDRQLAPLPVYDGRDKLVRGQQVVAIGSPLGLFNSISDGIIAGFRTIDRVDMIQFTAPISHGSSGGAVLNMYGEVIGISTAGFDDGQNINLAMGYECIRMFAKGIIR